MFADQLKHLRKQQGLSQDKLATILNHKYETTISKSMISRWENSVTDPQMKYVRLLADYFGVSAEYILGDTVDKASINRPSRPKIRSLARRMEKLSDDDLDLIDDLLNKFDK